LVAGSIRPRGRGTDDQAVNVELWRLPLVPHSFEIELRTVGREPSLFVAKLTAEPALDRIALAPGANLARGSLGGSA
jgi:hypothetical protein